VPEQATSRGQQPPEWRLDGLPPVAASVRAARRFVADALREAGQEPLLDDAVLAVSEVVTNAVIHAGTPMDLAVRAGRDGVRVEVADSNRRRPRFRDDAGLPTTGRGLRLLDALAADWGTEARPEGKAVWFRLPPAPP
jgi:anti-sigma regulatory factor (Ser/Thr protein kinase)